MKNNLRGQKGAQNQNNHKSQKNQQGQQSHRGGRVLQRQSAPAQRKEAEIPKNWRVIVGQHAISEAIQKYPKNIELAYLRQDWEDSEDLQQFEKKIKIRNVKIEIKSNQTLDKISTSHQGAVLFVSKKPDVDWVKVSEKDNSVVLVLDGIEDPHNLGAITRTAWLFGVDAIVIPQDRAVGLTPVVHKVACGGVEHVPIEKVNQFSTTVDMLKEKGFWVYGLSHKATKTIYDVDLPEKIVWAIGAEDKGLRTTTERLCDELVSIPQVSQNASFNASVASAIALSEAKRARMRRDKMKKTQ